MLTCGLHMPAYMSMCTPHMSMCRQVKFLRLSEIETVVGLIQPQLNLAFFFLLHKAPAEFLRSLSFPHYGMRLLTGVWEFSHPSKSPELSLALFCRPTLASSVW